MAAFADRIERANAAAIVFADGKAWNLFLAVSAMLAALQVTNRLPLWKVAERGWPQGLLEVFTLACLIASAALALLVLAPRRETVAGSRLLYWESIAAFRGPAEYLDAVSACSTEQLAVAQLENAYALARLCLRKFRLLRWSIILGAMGLFSGLIVFAVFDLPS